MFGWKSDATKQLELLRGIVEKQESFERRVKALELDWENMYDKFRSMLQRITKRAEVIEKAKPEEPAPDEAPVIEAQNGRLSPHQRNIQQLILRRRSGFGGAQQ